jgi:serine/threonine-protein kinase
LEPYGGNEIIITLVNPILQSVPIKSWTFRSRQPTISIGRAAENHVVLYSAVVSRHHLEVRRQGLHWEIVNLSANGTFVDEKPIDKMTVLDGLKLRLARSGPILQFHLGKPSPPSPSPEAS